MERIGDCSPKDPSVRIVGFKDTVHNAPVYIGTHPIKGNFEFLANHAGSSVTSNKEFGADGFFFTCTLILDTRLYRVSVQGAFRSDGEVCDGCLPFDQLVMAE